jgi:hypothetical protein
MTSRPASIDCRGLVGLAEAALIERFGPIASRRDRSGETWLVFQRPALALRVRLARSPGDAVPRLASWTATFADGFETLSDATGAVGLWPDAAPDASAADLEVPLVRRALAAPGGRAIHSLTATIRGGRFIAVSVFDEAPEWVEPDGEGKRSGG